MFKVNRIALAEELSVLQTVAEKKGTLPILSTLLFRMADEWLHLTATDLDVTIETRVKAKGEVWAGCIPARQLHSLVRLLSCEEISFTPKANSRIELVAESSKHLFPTVEATAYPAIPETKGNEVMLDGKALREGLAHVLPSVSTEESRYNLLGVQFETEGKTLNLIATDQHRLALASMSCDGEVKVLIPTRAIQSLLRLEAVQIEMRCDSNRIAFQCGERLLTARLIDGLFPNWRMVMPKDLPYKITLEPDALTKAIKRANATRTETYKVGEGVIRGGMCFTFGRESLVVSTFENDRGHSEETVSITSNLNGETYPVGLNPDYVLDFVARQSGELTCQMKDPNTQLLFTAPNGFSYIVMPMRL